MTEFNLYLIVLYALVGLFCVLGVWRLWARSRARKGTDEFVNSVLADAIKQQAAADLKILGEGGRSGLAVEILGRSRKGLVVQANAARNAELKGERVEVYFRVQHEEGPVFFVFESTVLEVHTSQDKMQLELALPDHLRVEQKRHFVRAQPNINDIIMLAVWQVAPGKRLPRANADLGQPLLSYKAGQDNPQIMVENISGSGIGLCFTAGALAEGALDSRKGRQIICLLVYRPEPQTTRPVVFWCSAEIRNARENGKALFLGLEFTNWAIQEQNDTEIHWMHNSPWRGVRPVLQWVQRMEKAKNPKGG